MQKYMIKLDTIDMVKNFVNTAAMFQEELYDELDGPVARIAALDVPMPYNIAMEHYSIPDVNRICASIRAMMD